MYNRSFLEFQWSRSFRIPTLAMEFYPADNETDLLANEFLSVFWYLGLMFKFEFRFNLTVSEKIQHPAKKRRRAGEKKRAFETWLGKHSA